MRASVLMKRGLSVCLCVGYIGERCKKTAELIDMPFGGEQIA